MPYLTRRLNTIVLQPDDYHTDAKKEGIAGVCGRGWVGTKGNCKRRSAKGKLTAKQKAGAQALADRIRAERGMKPRSSAESRFKQALENAGGANDLPVRKTRATPEQERKFQEALSKAANPPKSSKTKLDLSGLTEKQAKLIQSGTRSEKLQALEKAGLKGYTGRQVNSVLASLYKHTNAQNQQRRTQTQQRIEENRKIKPKLPSDRPTSSSNTIVSQSSGLAARPTRKEQLNALAYQAGKLLGDRAKADIEITRKAIEQNAPAVKKALVEGAKKVAFNAGKGFGGVVKAAQNKRKNK